jgi:hypothetical protein
MRYSKMLNDIEISKLMTRGTSNTTKKPERSLNSESSAKINEALETFEYSDKIDRNQTMITA